MAIAIPVLDDRTYADLVAEARALIPVFDPGWTNYNPSDPGITLLELFAWLVEMQIYGLDQITDEHRVTFLRLQSGPELEPARNPDGAIDKGWLDTNTAAIIQSIREISRAVSAADYETLALAVPGVGRARCAPRRNLDIANAAAARTPPPAARDRSPVLIAMPSRVPAAATPSARRRNSSIGWPAGSPFRCAPISTTTPAANSSRGRPRSTARAERPRGWPPF